MVLLIGATGFLGPAILKEVLGKNYTVSCLVRVSSDRTGLLNIARSAGKKLTFSTGTLRSGDSIIASLKKARIIIYMVDLEYTNLLEIFLETIIRTQVKRVIFIGSTTVLTPLDSMIKNQKINSENLIKKSGLDYTILRPSMIYGCPDNANFSRMIKFIKKRGFFITFGSGNNLIQPVYIEDVARATAEVLEDKKTYRKIYNLTGKEPLKYSKMIEIVRAKMGKQFKLIKFPIGFSKLLISLYGKVIKNPALTPGQIERMRIDKAYSYNKAAADFNYSPLDFKDGIEKLIKELETLN